MTTRSDDIGGSNDGPFKRFFDTYRDPVGWRIGLGVWLANFILNLGFVVDSGMTGLVGFFTITNATGLFIGAALWPLFVVIDEYELVPTTALVLMVSAIATGLYLALLYGLIIPMQEPAVGYPSWLGPAQLIFLVFFAGYGLYAMVLRNRRVLDAQRCALEQAVEAQKARVDSLRYQVNPHFLFNALNACSALIADDRPMEARSLLNDLSDFYRASLADAGDLFAPLEDEIALQMQYLQIEKVRFADRLQTRVDLDPETAAARVPVLILQPLVENAVKHGVARRSEPTLVTIGARAQAQSLTITISNPIGPGDAPGQPGTNTGVENVRRRLAALFGQRAAVDLGPQDPFTVTLTLPLIFDE